MDSGSFLSLGRDDARELFSYKTDEEVASFCLSKLEDEANVCHLGEHWQDFQASLAEYAATLDDENAAAMLSRVVNGGRSLYHSDDKLVQLVRPDVAAHVADLLHGFASSLPADSPLNGLSQHVKSLFSQSNEARRAVVFFAR